MSALKDSTLATGWGAYPISSQTPAATRLKLRGSDDSDPVYKALLRRLQQESTKVAEISETEADAAAEQPLSPGSGA
jgi:hypothetical protein